MELTILDINLTIGGLTEQETKVMLMMMMMMVVVVTVVAPTILALTTTTMQVILKLRQTITIMSTARMIRVLLFLMEKIQTGVTAMEVPPVKVGSSSSQLVASPFSSTRQSASNLIGG